ncbi:hypothetical protein VL20_2548 [Microcystis panniformis FACHB-1757]|uniref:Uncharacterized protein n=1 Tax=Microcystis panniformis FACHB-1757 TaxID=1638788 RepID=A0A0K1S104_9CHRO|nr:hypothetical protein VL20_2548 [Microcystis panniformis FACHB-1757]
MATMANGVTSRLKAIRGVGEILRPTKELILISANPNQLA